MKRSNPNKPVSPIPEFMSAGDGAQYLGLSSGSLRRIQPFVHHLELPHGEETRSVYQYPVPFLVPLRSALETYSHIGFIGAAEEFSYTPTARDAILTAERRLDKSIDGAAELNEDDKLSRVQVSQVLEIGRTTLNGWMDKGYLEVAKSDEGLVEVSVSALRQSLAWNRPIGYDPFVRSLDTPLVESDLVLHRPDVS